MLVITSCFTESSQLCLRMREVSWSAFVNYLAAKAGKAGVIVARK
jgi:hypothetical protein